MSIWFYSIKVLSTVSKLEKLVSSLPTLLIICFPVGFLEKLFASITDIESIKVFSYCLRPKWFHPLIIPLPGNEVGRGYFRK